MPIFNVYLKSYLKCSRKGIFDFSANNFTLHHLISSNMSGKKFCWKEHIDKASISKLAKFHHQDLLCFVTDKSM